MSPAPGPPGQQEFWLILSDLHRRHYGSLVGLASLYLDGSCEDAVQDAFVRVSLRWERIKEPDKVLLYLRRAVLNNAKSELRRRRTAARHAGIEPVSAPGSEEAALRRIADERIIRHLRLLPERQRACVGLRFYLDLSEKETAAVLSISTGSVKQHTSRAMKKLAPTFQEG